MRQFGAIFLLFTLFFPQGLQAALVANYLVEMDAIEAEFCVNKDQPELECHGSCHLQSQIAKTSPSTPENPDAPILPKLHEFLPVTTWVLLDVMWTFNSVYTPAFESNLLHESQEAPSPPPKKL